MSARRSTRTPTPVLMCHRRCCRCSRDWRRCSRDWRRCSDECCPLRSDPNPGEPFHAPRGRPCARSQIRALHLMRHLTRLLTVPRGIPNPPCRSAPTRAAQAPPSTTGRPLPRPLLAAEAAVLGTVGRIRQPGHGVHPPQRRQAPTSSHSRNHDNSRSDTASSPMGMPKPRCTEAWIEIHAPSANGLQPRRCK